MKNNLQSVKELPMLFRLFAIAVSQTEEKLGL
jgi:hypothetical protein